jgi:hypothetical protein
MCSFGHEYQDQNYFVYEKYWVSVYRPTQEREINF